LINNILNWLIEKDGVAHVWHIHEKVFLCKDISEA